MATLRAEQRWQVQRAAQHHNGAVALGAMLLGAIGLRSGGAARGTSGDRPEDKSLTISSSRWPRPGTRSTSSAAPPSSPATSSNPSTVLSSRSTILSSRSTIFSGNCPASAEQCRHGGELVAQNRRVLRSDDKAERGGAVTDEQKEADRKSLTEALEDQSRSYDQAILTISAGTLAVSVTFAQGMTPSPLQWSLLLLVGGWSFLALAILLMVWSFRVSQSMLRTILRDPDLVPTLPPRLTGRGQDRESTCGAGRLSARSDHYRLRTRREHQAAHLTGSPRLAGGAINNRAA